MDAAPALLLIKPSSFLRLSWLSHFDHGEWRVPAILFSVYPEVKHGGIAELILNEIRQGGYEIEYP